MESDTPINPTTDTALVVANYKAQLAAIHEAEASRAPSPG
jgi:hypothetical protein